MITGWWHLMAVASVLVPNVFEPAPDSSVRFGGWLGHHHDVCVTGGLVGQDLEAVIKPYRDKVEIGNGDWRCEYWGKWFTGLALGDAYAHNAASAAARDAAVDALLATAADDGYLGTRIPEHRGKGWDIWGRKYTLLGLIAAYDRTGDQATLDAALRAADTLLAQFGPGKAHLPDYGYEQWKGLPSSSVLEPIALLYERTGEARLLDFAQYIVGAWDQPGVLAPQGMRLIQDALAGKKPTELVAAKAYEQMSCFEGLCELYRGTGNRQYLDAALALAEGVLKHEVTLIGPGSSGEQWFEGKLKQTEAMYKPMEVCVTATWMKLCYQLLRLTGEARWAEEIERNLYNAMTATQMPDGRWWAFFVGPNGERVPSVVHHDDVGLSCCIVSGPRGLMLTPKWAAGTSAEGLVVNLYAPGQASLPTPGGQTAHLQFDGNYPFAEQTTIRLSLARPEPFELALRIPAWSHTTRLTVNGAEQPTPRGDYARLQRLWQDGDQIVLTVDLTVRAQTAPVGNGQIALTRGPVVLTLDEQMMPAREGLATIRVADDGTVAARVDDRLARRWGKQVVVRVPSEAGDLVFCDFPSAGAGWSSESRYRSWLPQPLDLATVYDTGQTWQTLSHRQDARPEVPAARRGG